MHECFTKLIIAKHTKVQWNHHNLEINNQIFFAMIYCLKNSSYMSYMSRFFFFFVPHNMAEVQPREVAQTEIRIIYRKYWVLSSEFGIPIVNVVYAVVEIVNISFVWWDETINYCNCNFKPSEWLCQCSQSNAMPGRLENTSWWYSSESL